MKLNWRVIWNFTMNKMNKARKISNPLIRKLMAETTDLQKQQVEDRIQLAMDLDILVKQKFDSYTAFAVHLGRSVSEVSRWLSGTHNLTQATLSEIAFGLGFTLKELFVHIDGKPEYVLVYSQQFTVANPLKDFKKPQMQKSEYSFHLNA